MTRRRRRARVIGLVVLALVVASALPAASVWLISAGHRYDEADVDVPRADVVLVLGAEVAPGGQEPKAFLRGRLDTAALLLREGRGRVILVSGDARGGSGDETSVMRSYLSGPGGVDPRRIVTDPYGLDTYDSCVRARQVYGVTRALVVTQPYHLARAVTLCRRAGIDADGVGARCACVPLNVARNAARDYLAASKAAWDLWRGRPAAIQSPPSDAVAVALTAV